LGRFNKKELRQSTSTTGQPRNWRQTKPVSIADSVRRVLDSLSMLNVTDDRVIVSTNIEPRLDGLPRSGKEASDPGVAVYWSTIQNPKQKCMAVDRYINVADNIAAVAATLEAMRAIERHGGAEVLERAFLGFQALPAPTSAGRPWPEVLDGPDASVPKFRWTLEYAEDRYRLLAKTRHPDNGGSDAVMAELNAAIAQAREVLR